MSHHINDPTKNWGLKFGMDKEPLRGVFIVLEGSIKFFMFFNAAKRRFVSLSFCSLFGIP